MISTSHALFHFFKNSEHGEKVRAGLESEAIILFTSSALSSMSISLLVDTNMHYLTGGSVFFFISDDIFFQNVVVSITVVIIAITCLSLLRRRKHQAHLKEAAAPAADAAIIKRRNDDEVILRAAKLEFLERVGNRYGYRNSEKGYIDDWRESEFPSLISPIQIITTSENAAASGADNRRRCSPAQKQTAVTTTLETTEKDDFLEQEVYLDYAGSALPTWSQLLQCLSTQQTQYQILANPHSMGGGHASDRTMVLLHRVKDEVRNHFGIYNDNCRLFLDENNNDEEEEERERRTKEDDEYQFIFTSGATASLKLVAERFPWTSLKFTTSSSTASSAAAGQQYSQILMKCDTIPSATNDDSIQYNNLHSIHFRSILLYPKNAHTSVIGMRNISLQHEATFHCVTVEELLLEATSPYWFQRLVVDDATIISYKDSMEEALKKYNSDANCCRNEEKKDDHNVAQEQCCEDDMTSVTCKTIWVHHLLVLPQECNFSGDRFDWSNTVAAARNSTFCTYLNCSKATTGGSQHQPLRVCHKWNILLDVAKAAATSPVDIPNMCSPDYAVASFYKMFGYPTGLGILIMKKEPKRAERIMDGTSKEESMMINSSEAPSIQEENFHSPRRRHYFGGGSVDVILPHKDFVITRNSQQLVDNDNGEHVSLGVMVHGTEHFRGILQLTPGFKELASLGGMEAICSHATCLAEELVCRLKKLVHDNGSSVVQIYGRWDDIAGKNTPGTGVLLPGPTVTFNIQDRDGSIIGYDEVSRLSSLNNPPIQLRTGCFCNPGACQEALALSESDVLEHYQSGHVCGDRRGVINGKPTGAIRASFGKDSVWEDMNALVSFIQRIFVSRGGALSLSSARIDNARNENTAVIDNLFVFPIKSCAAMKVNRWPIHRQTGRFLFDREFALVDSSGLAMRLHSYPQMSQIHSSIDLDTNILIVSAPHCDDLVLSLDVSEGDETIAPEDVQVCGVLCKGTIWGGRKASSWFSSILGVRCWLARHHVDEKKTSRSGNKRNDGLAYSNEASLLLVSQNSISVLNSVITSQGWGKQVVARHFRPNIVVSSSSGAREEETDCEGKVISNPEDFWQKICIKSDGTKDLELVAVGKCARCQMVDVDPDSGMKGKTLRALAEYRRERGKMLFGTFFTANTNESSEVFWAEEGAEVRASSLKI